ncbi:MAG: HD domain-containing protein, partial [Thermoleophilaceae bacterium]
MYEDAILEMQIRAPAERNPKLAAFLKAVNADMQLKAWWYAQQVTADRQQMSDHSWIHVQKVMNIALRLLRLLSKRGVEPVVVRDHGFTAKDAEVVVAAAALLHDTGMSIHRTDHEAYSLFLASRKLDSLLDGIYDEPARSILASEILHAIIGHRRRGDPLTLEAGIVRVADALDME